MTTTEPKDTAGRITQAELARRLKVSRPSVSKAVKTGRITPDEDGLFDPVEAELQWLSNTRPKAQGITTKGKHSSGYAEARARKEHALARMAELRLEQATGALVEMADVEFVLLDNAQTLQGLLDNLPDRLAAPLLAVRDVEGIRRYLEDAFFQLRHDLADTLERRVQEYFPAPSPTGCTTGCTTKNP